MRRNFAQILKEVKIDLKNEYTKLYTLFYGKDGRDDKSIAELVSYNFEEYYFRGTCLSLEEFNKVHGFRFEAQPQDFNEDYLVNFMEYMYNLILPLRENFFFYGINKSAYLNQIHRVVDMMGYVMASEDGLTIFVPQDNNAIAVAESDLIPDNLSYKVLEYNHHSMKGDIESKRDILLKLANILEGKRKQLDAICKGFSSDLFQLLNACNIRHNNTDVSSRNYYKYVAEMTEDELEHTYDEIYQMCLLAFMQLEHAERKVWLDNIKYNIINVK